MTGRLWFPRDCWLAVWFSRCIAPCKDWREYCHTEDEGGTNGKTWKKRKSSLFCKQQIYLMGQGVYSVSLGERAEKTKKALCLSSRPSQPLAARAPTTGLDEAERNAKGPTTLPHQTATKISPKWNNSVKFFPLASADILGLAQNTLQDDIVQKMCLCPLQVLKLLWPSPPRHFLWSSSSNTTSVTDPDPTSITNQWAFHQQISAYISVEALSMKAELALQQGENPRSP